MCVCSCVCVCVFGGGGHEGGVIVKRPGGFVGKSAGLVIERLRVRIPAGAVGAFSSPELTLCVGSYWVSIPPPPCYCSGM